MCSLALADKHLAGLELCQVGKMGSRYNWQIGKLVLCSSAQDRCLPDTAEGAELAAVGPGQESQELQPEVPVDCILGTAVLVEEQSVGCSQLREQNKEEYITEHTHTQA